MKSLKNISKQEKKSTFCIDCLKNECSKNPVQCMQGKEANLYFKLYNSTDQKFNILKG